MKKRIVFQDKKNTRDYGKKLCIRIEIYAGFGSGLLYSPPFGRPAGVYPVLDTGPE
jgi:hypothetical protein